MNHFTKYYHFNRLPLVFNILLLSNICIHLLVSFEFNIVILWLASKIKPVTFLWLLRFRHKAALYQVVIVRFLLTLIWMTIKKVCIDYPSIFCLKIYLHKLISVRVRIVRQQKKQAIKKSIYFVTLFNFCQKFYLLKIVLLVVCQ